MDGRPRIMSGHAKRVMLERNLEEAWIDLAIDKPDWRMSDPRRDGVDLRFKRIAERDGRVLRVAIVETPHEIRILTAFFDRRARRP